MNCLSLRLTKRRLEILNILAEYRYLTTNQYKMILGIKNDSQRRALQEVLCRGWRAGLLNRGKVVDYEDFRGFTPYELVYWFTKFGCEQIGKGTFNEEKSPRTLEHEVAISDCHMKLQTLCAENSLPFSWQQKDLKKTVHPDALFSITYPEPEYDNSVFHYFLEIEKSKQGHYRDGESGLLKKLRRYYEYYHSEQCMEDWGFETFHVLVVVRNDIRASNLLQALSTKLPSKMFWVATQDADLSKRVFLTPIDYAETAYAFVS